MWRRKRLSCREAGGECEFNVEHGQVYNSPDGKVFRVQRLACARCGERVVVAKEQGSAFVPPAWRRDAAVEANF